MKKIWNIIGTAHQAPQSAHGGGATRHQSDAHRGASCLAAASREITRRRHLPRAQASCAYRLLSTGAYNLISALHRARISKRAPPGALYRVTSRGIARRRRAASTSSGTTRKRRDIVQARAKAALDSMFIRKSSQCTHRHALASRGKKARRRRINRSHQQISTLGAHHKHCASRHLILGTGAAS